MFLNTASPRRSFSVPISINLQGARRRQARELFPAAAGREPVRRRCAEARGCGEERAKVKVHVSSVGEDRAILLGLAMMTFSVLMFFVVGLTTVKPYVGSNWVEGNICVLLHADILEEGVICRGVSVVPCLQVTVNITDSTQPALLHYDEESVYLMPKCFYVPKCLMDRRELEDEVQQVRNNVTLLLGSSVPCLVDPRRYPGDAITRRAYTWARAMLALLWPGLMLCGGVLLVGLVKLTQCLAHMCSEVRTRPAAPDPSRLIRCADSASDEGHPAETPARGALYKLLRRASTQSAASPTDACAK